MTGRFPFDSTDHKTEFLIVKAAVVGSAAVEAGERPLGPPDALVMSSAGGATQDEAAFQAPGVERQSVGA